MYEETAMERSANDVRIFTTGGEQVEVNRLERVRAQGEKASGKDCKGSKRKAIWEGETPATYPYFDKLNNHVTSFDAKALAVKRVTSNNGSTSSPTEGKEPPERIR